MEPEPDSNPIETAPLKPYRRKIWVTVILNLLDPGFPLIYNGNLKGGILLTIILEAINLILFAMVGISFRMIFVIVLAFVVILAWSLIYNIRYTLRANQLNYPRLHRVGAWIFAVLAASLVISFVGDFFTKAFIVQSYRLPSASMENTLLVGDYLMASKRVDVDRLQRGDIIIFKFPGDTHQNYVKRIASLAGDRIEIIDKQLYVNDQLIPLPPEGKLVDSTHNMAHSDDKRWVTNDNAWGGAGGYWEYLGNRDNMPEMTVPAGQFFVLGDNRDNSADSRYWGPVDSKLVVGRAKFIHFSWDKEKFHIRWERIGKRLG